MPDTALITRNFILYFLLPFWLVLGFVDYLCHRRTRIETSSGLTESLIHWTMLVLVGAGIMLGLFFNINALVILAMIVIFLLHEVAGIWDVNYAMPRRTILVVERHLHNYLGVLPFMTASMVICLHWDQFLVLLGLGSAPDSFSLHLKQPPLSTNYLIGIFGGVFGLLVLPYAEELWRCWRVARSSPRL
ncbi:MAG: diguanylate cyclase [Acidobacteria bacterium]|nr:diguanylate cyclase [Acidobacteriota bacterium]